MGFKDLKKIRCAANFRLMIKFHLWSHRFQKRRRKNCEKQRSLKKVVFVRQARYRLPFVPINDCLPVVQSSINRCPRQPTASSASFFSITLARRDSMASVFAIPQLWKVNRPYWFRLFPPPFWDDPRIRNILQFVWNNNGQWAYLAKQISRKWVLASFS